MHVKHAKNECKCWRYKNCIISSFVRIKIMFIFCWNSVPFLTRKKICFPQNFLSFPSPYPLFLFCLFLFVFSVTHQNTGKPTNMNLLRLLLIKLYYTDLSFRYIYMHIILFVLSILPGYGIMFMHLSQNSDSKKSFRILRTSEYSAISINC